MDDRDRGRGVRRGPAAAARTLLGERSDEVSPLELFFDLVFVFAVSQLSEHLLPEPTWRGAAETLVLLVAVFGIWSATSWSVGFPQGGRAETPPVFGALFLALFVNAAIPRAFGPEVWAFLTPFLLCLVGRAALAHLTARTAWLREHSRAMLIWTAAEALLWVAGALVAPDARLGWWAAAALVNVTGSWAAHPLPGRRFHSDEVAFRPDRMIERSRLLLLIALGESVLTIGTALSRAPSSAASTATGVLALVTTTALWFLYFQGSDPVLDRSAQSAGDRLRVARIALNSQLVVLSGLIALAVANELAIEDPLATTEAPLAIVLLGGPALYLAAQLWNLHALGAPYSRLRLAGVVLLAAAFPLVLQLPRLTVVGLVAVVLTAVAVGTRQRAGAAARPAA